MVQPIDSIPQSVAARLRNYQVQPVATLADSAAAGRSTADTSDMGTGKTYTAVAVAATMDRPLVVACPRICVTGWGVASKLIQHDGFAGAFGYEKLLAGNTGFLTARKLNNRAHKKSYTWTLPEHSMLVLDEAHRCNGPDSASGRMLYAAVEAGVQVHLVSATLGQEPKHLNSIGYALGLHRGGQSFLDWLRGECGYVETEYGYKWQCGMRNGELYMKGDSGWIERPDGMRELFKRREAMMSGIRDRLVSAGRMVRVRRDLLPDFPELEIRPDMVDFGSDTAAMRRAYNEMVAQLEALRRRAVRDRKSALTIMLRALQELELLRVPTLVEMAQDAMDSGMSVGIMLNYDASVDAVCEKLGTKCRLKGADDDATRQVNIAAFQANKERAIVANSQAGGIGIGLHDIHGGFPRMGIVSPSFWAVKVKQATGRFAREGAKSKSLVVIPFAAGTVEESAYDAYRDKVQLIDALNDGVLQSGLPFQEPHDIAA